MNCPIVNRPLKFRYLVTCYGAIKTTQVIFHAGGLIYFFSASGLAEDSLLRYSNLISLYMLILNIWSLVMGIVFQIKRKIFFAYESILTVSMLVVYGGLIAALVVNERIKSPEYEVQFSNDTKENEKLNEELEDVVITTQPNTNQSFVNMSKLFSVHDLESSLVLPVILLLFQLLIIAIHCIEAFPNVDLEYVSYEEHEGQHIQLTLMESMERHLYSRDEERERRFVTEEGEVLTPDTVDTVSETRQQFSSSLQPEAPVHEEPTLAEEESPATNPRASASEPSSDSEGSSLTHRKLRGSKSITPEPPVEEEKGKPTES